MNDYEIKTCPFCGADCHIEQYINMEGILAEDYRVECDGPDGHALDWGCESEEEAVAVWNKRINNYE